MWRHDGVFYRDEDLQQKKKNEAYKRYRVGVKGC